MMLEVFVQETFSGIGDALRQYWPVLLPTAVAVLLFIAKIWYDRRRERTRGRRTRYEKDYDEVYAPLRSELTAVLGHKDGIPETFPFSGGDETVGKLLRENRLGAPHLRPLKEDVERYATLYKAARKADITFHNAAEKALRDVLGGVEVAPPGGRTNSLADFVSIPDKVQLLASGDLVKLTEQVLTEARRGGIRPTSATFLPQLIENAFNKSRPHRDAYEAAAEAVFDQAERLLRGLDHAIENEADYEVAGNPPHPG